MGGESKPGKCRLTGASIIKGRDLALLAKGEVDFLLRPR